ncbi:putative hydrolase of the HAD superfamily [Catalinimonas alkaloidigena]|uniref:HAD family hydrolase n=1 Tax=Catalinimonas alkaloidigena TaxID=1075417 RepID=UPI00240760C1|nr:HAD family hydrolase [Catalinimonas alkaloidigena]MDF9797971.1 putative hydrolase of the HAD superfamily [Catalinimonas alkaloidigena]
MNKPTIIAFDADDTLWVNETIFTSTQEKCKDILSGYISPELIEEKVYETERRNLRHFGYGIKGFVLSMIETAIELSEGKVSAKEIQDIIGLGKEMITHPVRLLNQVEETIRLLSEDFELMIITKGDLFDQESKIARSGLAGFFKRIEIISEKDKSSYGRVMLRNDINVKDLLMVGNSLKSDILPICELGGRAVHIPFHTTWVLEQISHHKLAHIQYDELATITQLPAYLKQNF